MTLVTQREWEIDDIAEHYTSVGAIEAAGEDGVEALDVVGAAGFSQGKRGPVLSRFTRPEGPLIQVV